MNKEALTKNSDGVELFLAPHHRQQPPKKYEVSHQAKVMAKFSPAAQYRFSRLHPSVKRLGIAYAASNGMLGQGPVLSKHSVMINTGTDAKVFSFYPDHKQVSIADQLGFQLENALGVDNRVDLVSNKHGKPLHEIHPAKIMTEVNWGDVSVRLRPDQPKRDPNLMMADNKKPQDSAHEEFSQYVSSLMDAAADHVADKIVSKGADNWQEKASSIGCRQKLTHHMARVLKQHGKTYHPKVSYGQYMMTHGVIYPNQFVNYMSYRMAHAVQDVHEFYKPEAKVVANCSRLKAVLKYKLKKAFHCNRMLRWLSKRWERCYRFIRCLNGYEDCRVDSRGRRTGHESVPIAVWHGYKSGGSSSSSSSSSSDDERKRYYPEKENEDLKSACCGSGSYKKSKGKKKGRKRTNAVITSGIKDEYGRVRPDLLLANEINGEEEYEGGMYSDDEEPMPAVSSGAMPTEYSDDDAIDALLDSEITGAYLPAKASKQRVVTISKAIASNQEEDDDEDPEIVGAHIPKTRVIKLSKKGKKTSLKKKKKEEDPEIVGAYLPDMNEDPEIVGAYLPEVDEDEFAGAYIPQEGDDIGCGVCSNDKDKKKGKGKKKEAQKKSAISNAIDNPVENFHRLWNSEANKPLIREWIGSDTENTYVMWPSRLSENIDSPAKVKAFLQKQSFKAPMRAPIRSQIFTSVDGSTTYAIDKHEKSVNGMASSHHEIAGGASASMADFPLEKGKIFVRPYSI